MNAGVSLGVGGAAFATALAGVLWWKFGTAVFAAMTEFGQLICG